ncbi:hypothetical protein HBM99_05470 [Providencia heimbachae]|uniref:hypothetical protein n=1 Tax=Providencia heimbachae TaxID=333962 RepID=UPI0014196607|nr:hypothetical protein [Providencia heimbachae]NIH21807.1 hypothetical protein [Providencia heimbachae]
MDKSRRQFEEFIKFHMDDAEVNNKFETANKGMNYADHHVDIMWIAWEASRESLEVKLPNKYNPELAGNVKTKNFFYGVNQGIDKCRDILISNGVKIKNE